MNVALSPTDELPPHKTFTVEDVLRMVDAGILRENDNVELIEGELVMMAAKYIPHERIKLALMTAFVRAVDDNLYVAVESSLQLSDDTIVEPDLAIVPRSLFSSTERLAQPKPQDLLLVIEVATSSMAYDRRTKARVYARHGVQEYWVIDANERITWVHPASSADGWSSVVERSPDETLATPAVPGFAVRLADIA